MVVVVVNFFDIFSKYFIRNLNHYTDNNYCSSSSKLF